MPGSVGCGGCVGHLSVYSLQVLWTVKDAKGNDMYVANVEPNQSFPPEPGQQSE